MRKGDIFNQLALLIERGKINKDSPFPPDLKGEDGASELTARALEEGIKAEEVLNRGLMPGMGRVGEKFRDGEIYVPDVLIAARAMNAALEHLKPYFISGEVKRKGKIILGTVAGDLHDIGKNLVRMVLEGGGWEVIDLGVDVPAARFIAALEESNAEAVAMSALLTTTMLNMKTIAEKVKEFSEKTTIIVGGAPLSDSFAKEIGADYCEGPHEALEFLNRKCA